VYIFVHLSVALNVCIMHMADSVEEGEKIVNATLDKFGRIGEHFYIFGSISYA